jgi:hypothetical protein
VARALFPVVLLCVAELGGCRCESSVAESVSDDPIVQARFETARRTLEDIVSYKKKGHNVFADCKTAEMLFTRELRRLKSAAAKQLQQDLQQACRGVEAP